MPSIAGEDTEQEISFTDNSGKPLMIFVQFITKINIVLTCKKFIFKICKFVSVLQIGSFV